MRISDWTSDVCSSDLHFCRLVERRLGLEGRHDLLHRRLLAALEAHKDEAVPDLALDRLQAELDRVELGQAGGPRRAAQSAVEVVAPAVERADQGGAALALGLDGDARAPVTADVVEGTNDAVGDRKSTRLNSSH